MAALDMHVIDSMYTFFFFIRTKFIRTRTLRLLKKLRTILDFKRSLFLKLTSVLTENNQGLFHGRKKIGTAVPAVLRKVSVQ